MSTPSSSTVLADSPIGRSSIAFPLQACATIFLSAFLLFQVQPLISRMILPWYGGAPAVWTTAMLFFQVVLVAGYAYAHLLTRLRRPRTQATVHAILLVAAVLSLPITPGDAWAPTPDQESPVMRILLLLLTFVGLPYVTLASTGPLIQSWFSRVCPDRSPYRLYALSNVGSLGALVTYPLVFEPAFTTSHQAFLWQTGFVVFAVICVLIAISFGRSVRVEQVPAVAAADAERPRVRQYLTWMLLPMVPSVMLLAITNHLCLDVAVIPFLWILPMSLYLVSFIICFDREAWYRRKPMALLTIGSILFACSLIQYRTIDGWIEDFLPSSVTFRWAMVSGDIWVQLVTWSVVLFAVCMLFHGEVVRRKPPSQHLTAFYLSISTGGALGGIFVGLICPWLFNNYSELNISLMVAFAFALVVFHMADRFRLVRRPRVRFAAIGLTALGLVLVVLVQVSELRPKPGRILSRRDFYGLLKVTEHRFRDKEDQPIVRRHLLYGSIIHGMQLTGEGVPTQALSYYGPTSGIGLAMANHASDRPRKVGVVGLGAGTMAGFAKEGDVFRFYEINPAMKRIAESYFTYLDDCVADKEFIMGDARLSMERESPQEYDVLLMDAFSGDAIPVHLITREAIEVYLRHLKEDGILAIHISNGYLDLRGVVERLAEEFDMTSIVVADRAGDDPHIFPTTWMLLSRSPEVLAASEFQEAASEEASPPGSLWTDSYSNLLETLY